MLVSLKKRRAIPEVAAGMPDREAKLTSIGVVVVAGTSVASIGLSRFERMMTSESVAHEQDESVSGRSESLF